MPNILFPDASLYHVKLPPLHPIAVKVVLSPSHTVAGSTDGAFGIGLTVTVTARKVDTHPLISQPT